MTNITKPSDSTIELIPLKNNPLGLVDDRSSNNKYRSQVRFNNRRKIFEFLSKDVTLVIQYLDFNMKKSSDVIECITHELSRTNLDFLSKNKYQDVLNTMLYNGLISKVNNNNADRRFYINPNVICKLKEEQRNEFALVHEQYFKPLT